MTVKEKARFIRELLDSVRVSLLGKLIRVPEHWDGHELREWIAETFDRERTLRNSLKRRKAYRKDVLVNNLD